MSEAPKAPRKDPRRRSRVPTLPPRTRSRAALGLDRAAAEGRFALQHCAECGAVQYPPRDACRMCLSPDLVWQETAPGGTLMGTSLVRISQEPYFRERAPWRVGLVAMDAGPSVQAHLHPQAERDGRVRLSLRIDKAGRGVMVAEPEKPDEEDPRMIDFASDPKGRRVLITDGNAPTGLALARAFSNAGASIVFVGIAESWLPQPAHEALRGVERVQIAELDVTDETSVQKALGSIGGKVDILVNNGHYARPGNLMERAGTHHARQEIDTAYLGLLRLISTFGHAMRGRGADLPANAAAWVNLLPVGAVAPQAGWGAWSAAAAAALSATLSLRAEMRRGGVRVCAAFHGPLDWEWRQGEPPPKLAPEAVARGVVDMLRAGREEAWIGDVARDVQERRALDPFLYEREALEEFDK